MTRLLTVDTGEISDVFVGALVTWMHVPRGGYGFEMPIDAKVIAYSRRPRTRVKIEVGTKAGRLVTRWVEAKNLRWRP